MSKLNINQTNFKMKKKIFITVSFLAIISAFMFGQDSTNVVVTVGDNMPIKDFLKTNGWALAFIVFSLVETWLGSTGKIKDGSVLALIINWISKLLRSKSPIVKSKEDNRAVYKAKKEEAMKAEKKRQFPNLPKSIVIGLVISGFALASLQAQTPEQSKWNGFWKPVDGRIFVSENLASDGTEYTMENSAWLFRPSFTLTAMKFVPTKEEGKVFDVSSFTSGGVGVGYQRYVNNNGSPYNIFGASAMILLDATPTKTTGAGISIAGAVNALEYINVGLGYDFREKTVFLMAGINYTF